MSRAVFRVCKALAFYRILTLDLVYLFLFNVDFVRRNFDARRLPK